jgi:hypothetical protein
VVVVAVVTLEVLKDVALEYPDLLLRVLQRRLAELEELRAALVGRERFSRGI